MTNDFISREAAIKAIREAGTPVNEIFYAGVVAAFKAVSALPAADVAQVVHGEYIERKSEKDMALWECSCCQQPCVTVHTKQGSTISVQTKRCAACGAIMDGGEPKEGESK